MRAGQCGCGQQSHWRRGDRVGGQNSDREGEATIGGQGGKYELSPRDFFAVSRGLLDGSGADRDAESGGRSGSIRGSGGGNGQRERRRVGRSRTGKASAGYGVPVAQVFC